MVDQSLATGFIAINTRQQRASLPFKPGVLVRKVYNNDFITFFSMYNVCQALCGSGCNTLSHEGLANINTWKRMFYPLIVLGDAFKEYPQYMLFLEIRKLLAEIPLT